MGGYCVRLGIGEEKFVDTHNTRTLASVEISSFCLLPLWYKLFWLHQLLLLDLFILSIPSVFNPSCFPFDVMFVMFVHPIMLMSSFTLPDIFNIVIHHEPSSVY